MQLVTLNIWGGHLLKPLLEFVSAHQEVDIFCFQEVYHNAPDMISEENRQVCLAIFSELGRLLPKHRGFFRPVVGGIYGIAVFVKNNIDVLDEGEITIHDNPSYHGRGPTHSRNLQWLKLKIDKQIYHLMNVHGLWNGMGKTDTPERILQAQRIRSFMDTLPAPKIICGDFNLRPDTKSLMMLEQGMKNLIKIFKVASTRTSAYTKNEKFADYILTSPDIIINKFSVLNDVVSDHAPLLLDFS